MPHRVSPAPPRGRDARRQAGRLTRARHVKRLGRRGGLLLLLAVLWAGVAAQVAAAHAPYDVDAAVLHERIPLGWRVGLWLASALIMAAAACIGTRDPRVQRIGWAAALVMPTERAVGYLWSVVMVSDPGPPARVTREPRRAYRVVRRNRNRLPARRLGRGRDRGARS